MQQVVYTTAIILGAAICHIVGLGMFYVGLHMDDDSAYEVDEN